MTNLLDNQQIKDYIANWFENKHSDQGKNFWEFLHKERNSQLKDLSKNPIFLNALCNGHYYHPSTNSHSSIYKDIFNLLLADYEIELFLEILQISAFTLFETNKTIFSENDLIPHIEYSLRRYRKAVNPFNIESILYQLIHLGILMKVDNCYSFTHLSLYEYLTAKSIYENDLINKTVLENVADPRYFNIFLFLVEMLKKKTDNFLAMITVGYYHTSKNPYVKDLLLQCKQRAIYVNKDIWQLIEKAL
jgi:predicted NACHT family NTPase